MAPKISPVVIAKLLNGFIENRMPQIGMHCTGTKNTTSFKSNEISEMAYRFHHDNIQIKIITTVFEKSEITKSIAQVGYIVLPSSPVAAKVPMFQRCSEEVIGQMNS